MAGVYQFTGFLLVNFEFLCLTVRPVGTSLVRALVGSYPQPVQGLLEFILGSGSKSLAVGILNSEDKPAPMSFGKGVIY